MPTLVSLARAESKAAAPPEDTQHAPPPSLFQLSHKLCWVSECDRDATVTMETKWIPEIQDVFRAYERRGSGRKGELNSHTLEL